LGVSGTHLVAYQWVSACLLLGALVALFSRRQGSSRRHATYLLLCIALPVAIVYAAGYVRPAYLNIRHLMFASPFYYLLLGAGFTQVRHIRLRRWARVAIGVCVGGAAVVLLVGMGLSTYAYFSDPQYDKEDHRGWGAYLGKHIRPGDVVFVYPGAVYELYTYYTSSSAPYYGIPLPGASPEQIVAHLVETAEGHERLWIAQSLTPGWANPDKIALRWLQENALRQAFAEFRGHLNTFPVYAFSLEPQVTSSLPSEASPLALDFDGQLRLLGYRSFDEPVTAGDPLRLSLYWSAPQSLDREYRITLSLDDDAGRSWSLLDYAPYDGTYPFARWPADGVVRDDIDIDVPLGTPPGGYSLNVSVYPDDRSEPSLAVRDLGSGQLLGLIVPVAQVTVARPDSDPSDGDLSMARLTRRRYGDLALLGHDYRAGTYRPGDVVHLDLYWRALREPENDVVFNLQLSDKDGVIRASRPIAPVDSYPTSLWREGELVRGKHRFRIPFDVPEGDYVLWLAPNNDEPTRGIWPWAGPRVRLGDLSLRRAERDLVFEVPPMQHTVGVTLGDAVELLGYDLENNLVRPGGVVSCTLYWRGLQEMDQAYTVFTHLVGGDGRTWGQWDNQPQRGQLPTTRWIPGQVISDPYEIPVSDVAPAGPLALHVGMYDLLTMDRLPVRDESGVLLGDSVGIAEVNVPE
jgi:hypothetical protein